MINLPLSSSNSSVTDLIVSVIQVSFKLMQCTLKYKKFYIKSYITVRLHSNRKPSSISSNQTQNDEITPSFRDALYGHVSQSAFKRKGSYTITVTTKHGLDYNIYSTHSGHILLWRGTLPQQLLPPMTT